MEALEDRTLFSVNTGLIFKGLDANVESGTVEPPDPIAAAGPTAIVEEVNSHIVFYNKAGQLLNMDHPPQGLPSGEPHTVHPDQLAEPKPHDGAEPRRQRQRAVETCQSLGDAAEGDQTDAMAAPVFAVARRRGQRRLDLRERCCLVLKVRRCRHQFQVRNP